MTEEPKTEEHLTLKWGTLKGWHFNEGSEAHKAFKEYNSLGMSMGAAQQKDTAKQKELICKIIDSVDCSTITNDWEGTEMSKEEAKQYVMNY